MIQQYNFNPTGLPNNISPAYHQAVFQLIDGLTQQVDLNTKNLLMQSLNTNTSVIINLHNFIMQEAMKRGVDLRVAGASLHQQDLQGILYQWCSGAINTIRNNMQQSNMGYQQSGINPNIMGGMQQGVTSMYSSGSHAAPNQMNAIPTMQTQVNSPNVNVPLSAQTKQHKETPAVVETLTWHREPLDEDNKLDRTRGLEIIETPWTSTINQVRLALTNFKSRRIESSAFDAYRDLEHMLSDGMKRGYWVHRLLYTMTGHIDMPTTTFTTIRDAIRKIYVEQKWRGVLKVLQDQSQGVWSKIDNYLVARLNDAFLMRLRLENDMGVTVSIDSISDLVDLCDPHFTSPLSEHPAFADLLDRTIDKIMVETFLHDTVALPDRRSLTALMKCRQVEYFNGSTTKFDYGILENKAKNELIDSLFANNTVLTVPRCLLATNTLPSEETTNLSDPQWLTDPQRQGVFTQIFDRIVDDQKPLPDTIILNQYRVAPSDWLNIIKPVYPMGSKSIYLIGSNRMIGW